MKRFLSGGRDEDGSNPPCPLDKMSQTEMVGKEVHLLSGGEGKRHFVTKLMG